jgi:hypothetical protein
MEWKSINDFKPLTCVDLFLRIETMDMYERYIVAKTENLETAQDPATWDIANGQIMDIDLSNYIVTHFAIPDPVEIKK